MSPLAIIFIALAVIFLLVIAVTLVSSYRMCPPDRILVVYGKVAAGQSSRCYHGGATFVMPFFQSYAYLDLTPINIDIELKGALSSQNIRIDTPASFTIGISTDAEVMQNAATRLLGRSLDEIQQLASEIIMGQMRVVFASMTIEEINNDREKLISSITKGVEVELHKVGLRMINGNIRDIKDQSGYIDALGKEAAAKAINDAQIRVAQENQRGSVGRAEAEREHPREEAFPLLRREEVGPFETSINALLPRCPSADESPEILQRGNSCAQLGAARQPTSRRRLDADDGREDAGQPPPIGRGLRPRGDHRHIRRIEGSRHVEVADTTSTRHGLHRGRSEHEGAPSDGLGEALDATLAREEVGHLVILRRHPREEQEAVVQDLQHEEALEQQVEALRPRPALDGRLLKRLIVHVVADDLALPSRPLRLDAADHGVALKEVDRPSGGSRAVPPVIEWTPA